MSEITNLVLSLGIFDAHGSETLQEQGPKVEEVNRFFGSVKGLVDLDSATLPRGWYGGTKMLQAHLFVGAYNHFDLRGFITHLRSIKWAMPECVQLFVREEEDVRFRLINIMDDLPRIGSSSK